MKIRMIADQERYKRMTTAELRKTYLIDDLFRQGEVAAHYVDMERRVVGSAVPVVGKPLVLATADALRAAYFLERRELGILNVGGKAAPVTELR